MIRSPGIQKKHEIDPHAQAMFPVFPSIKHASLWCRMNGDDFFLFKTSGFLKIDPQKIILRRFEKYFRNFLRSKFSDFKKIQNRKFSKSKFLLGFSVFDFEIFWLRKFLKSKISNLKNCRKYFSSSNKIFYLINGTG